MAGAYCTGDGIQRAHEAVLVALLLHGAMLARAFFRLASLHWQGLVVLCMSRQRVTVDLVWTTLLRYKGGAVDRLRLCAVLRLLLQYCTSIKPNYIMCMHCMHAEGHMTCPCPCTSFRPAAVGEPGAFPGHRDGCIRHINMQPAGLW
jgi:hypothetical protein